MKRKLVIPVALVLSACSPTRGCMESHFQLAADSRLPKWVDLPTNLKREDATIDLEYWGGPLGGSVTVKVNDKAGKQFLSLTGNLEGGWGLGEASSGDRSVFYKVTINGVSELVEHRPSKAGFYITDDPDLRRRYHLQ